MPLLYRLYVFEVCQECNSQANPFMNMGWIRRTMKHQCLRIRSLEVPALMWTPSLCSQVWVEAWSLEGERVREWENGGVARVWECTRKLPMCKWVGGVGVLEGHHSVDSCNYDWSRAVCLIILHNVHLKQYLHMSIQFNIWVTPSSQLQNTPQHGSSGQPIMQHVTKVVGSIFGAQNTYQEKIILFSEI